jgi:lipoprotein-anchoring transpeptidase ErfK/SrfK
VLGRVVLVSIAIGILSGCGGGGAAAPVSAPTVAPSSVRPASTAVPTTRPLAPGVSLVAQATVAHLAVFDHPHATRPVRVLDNPWTVDPSVPASTVPQVFLVQTRRADGWLRVLLPIRPNGSTGWVRTSDVSVRPVAFRIRVELAAHRITVFDHLGVLYRGPVAVGKPATPTPTGHYFIRVLMEAPNPNTVYGPYAYGLSSHSDALTTFEGADAEIGIHGNNDASVLGHDATHGCIRMDNSEITKLARMLPLGTPVDVVA